MIRTTAITTTPDATIMVTWTSNFSDVNTHSEWSAVDQQIHKLLLIVMNVKNDFLWKWYTKNLFNLKQKKPSFWRYGAIYLTFTPKDMWFSFIINGHMYIVQMIFGFLRTWKGKINKYTTREMKANSFTTLDKNTFNILHI